MSRGKLRIYLGASPGVGKTYAMLEEGRRRSERGGDVVIGIVETHGRQHTIARLGDLEVVPRRPVPYRDTTLLELDVDAVLARRPAVALVDELAHTNAPGSENVKRWADIDQLLDAGIDVISTVNIQHLESVNDVVERITGIRQQETVPDAWVRRAEQIELVDMTPEALRRRMAHGNVYPSDRIDAAMSNYFRPGNLAALRELALLWLADRVEDQLQDYLETHSISDQWETRERVLVALTGAPGNDQIIRRAARIAGRLRGDLVGVHIASPDGLTGSGSELASHRVLLEELGGSLREAVGDDVAETLVAVARSERATQVVIGASRRTKRQELTGGSVVNRILRLARDLDVHVISTDLPSRSTWPSMPRRTASLSRRRRAIVWTMVVIGLPVIALLLTQYRSDLGLTTMLLATLGFVVAVSAVGGLAPGLAASLVGAGLANYHLVPPIGQLTVDSAENAAALVMFVAVGTTVAILVDRVARRSAESLRSRLEATALARAAATQAVEADPLPSLVEQVRATFDLDSVAVLRQNSDGHWDTQAAAGPTPPTQPQDGDMRQLGSDPQTVVVFGGGVPADRDPEIVEAFLDQLSVAVERRGLQQTAASAAAMEEADALRTGILQAVSHDLRTPLSGIKASVTSLMAPDVHFDAEDTQMFLQTIDQEVDRLDRVVGDLLDMGRLQTGTLTMMRRPTALEEVVSAALSNLAVTAEQVALEVPETLPLVELDPALLERALANVLANALAVQPAGQPVRIEAARVGPERDEVHLRVIDHGPGIRPENRLSVLEPFQRLGDRSSQAGVGLGLAIASGFTRLLGGQLDLDDTPGGGLTVTFRLPAFVSGEGEQLEPEFDDDQSRLVEESRARDAGNAQAAMTRVLVVDDEPQIRKALDVNLVARDYEVSLAATGEQALVLAAEQPPDIVLLDMGLPGIDGFGVIGGLRRWTDVPIIVLSVRGEESDKIDALDAGADDYISKPFGIGELLARMRSALRRSRSESPEQFIVTPDFEIDLAKTRITRGVGTENPGEEIRLTPIEWALVAQLVRHPGRLVTQRQLLQRVWGPGHEAQTNYLRVHLANLRRKLEPEPATPRYFVTEAGMGYRFENVPADV